jgi:uncharacterized protein YxeA
LSVLTKILIVIVSILTLIFSAVTAAYVGSAENYKDECAQLKTQLNAANSENVTLRTNYDNKSQQFKDFKEESQKEKAELSRKNSELLIDLRTSETVKLEKERRLDSLLAELTALRTTIGNMETSLKSTQEELEKARSTSIEEKTRLTELTDTLYQRIGEIRNLEVQVKRLLEEKTILEDQVSGTIAEMPEVNIITPESDIALPVEPTPVNSAAVTGAKGKVTAINGGLAEVSIGAADGLRKNDILHVYRGGDFICDISITDVDTNKAAGIIELPQKPLEIGDIATMGF